jgi:RNA polymerase sigma-70 factor (ECF subfamily)
VTTTRERRFEALYRSTRNDILAYLVRRVAQPADAADALADVYLTAWRRFDEIPPGAEARLWLYGVARRVLSNHYRGGQRRTRVEHRLAAALLRAEADGAGEADSPVAQRVEQVVGAMQDLSDADREALMLHAWDRLSSSEIAALTGTTAAAVRVRIHRARARLRTALASDEPARCAAD